MEVYIAKLDNVIVYIGSGSNGRHRHVNSGTSHVYELNKDHFNGISFDIEVIGNNYTKEESLVVEKELIEKYQPKYNRVYRNKDRSISANERRDFYKKANSYYESLRHKTKLNIRQRSQHIKYSEQLIVLIKEFKLTEVPTLVTFPVIKNISSEYKTVHRILIGENKAPPEFDELFESIVINKNKDIPRSFHVSVKLP